MLNADRTMVLRRDARLSYVQKPKAKPQRNSCLENDEISCPVCRGKGERQDAKTKELRPCVACKGTKKIKK